MNLFTNILHILGSGATAYVLSRNIRDSQTRCNLLMRFYISEYTSVPFLEALKVRAIQENDQWLSEQLARHAADELKHSRIFAHALKQCGSEPIDFENLPPQKKNSSSSSFNTYFEGYSREELSPHKINWITYAGSTYILELDSGKDYARMANILPDDDPVLRKIKQGILSIAKDETRHASYCYEILTRRLPQSKVNEVVEYWRTRKVKTIWAMANKVLQNNGKMPTLPAQN